MIVLLTHRRRCCAERGYRRTGLRRRPVRLYHPPSSAAELIPTAS